MILFFGSFLISGILNAEIRLPNVLGSHMVLQQDKPIKIWGWASPGERITVTFVDLKAETKADEDGFWEVTLSAKKADGLSHNMNISGTKSQPVVLKDIMLGEVWICSGQSNMQWSMLQTHSPTPEILKADFPKIRLFYVPRTISTQPLDDVQAEWEVCSPETVAGFSAVGYYFGREIHLEM